MTTPAAEALYLAQHKVEVEGRRYAIFNPHNKPVDELPFIIGFNNGGSPGWFSAQAIAEDGMGLGSHICSHEGYMESDLGILEGSREDRHAESYQKHYPDGYRMDFVPSDQVKNDPRLTKAFELNKALAAKAKDSEQAQPVQSA